MSRKNKVTQNAVSVESIKDDKRKCKSKKMIQKELEELVSKLKDQNDDHIEIVRNTKQTQSQLVQLEETNGKNKKQKMETAQNNLKNLKKRQIELEKKMKDVLGKMRGLGDEVNLEKECKGLTGVLEVVTAMTKKKKNKVGNEQVKQEEQKESDKKLDSVKIQKKDSSPLNEAHYAAATFAMPPHFSEFIKTPEKEKNPAKKHEKVRSFFVWANAITEVFISRSSQHFEIALKHFDCNQNRFHSLQYSTAISRCQTTSRIHLLALLRMQMEFIRFERRRSTVAPFS